MANQIGIITDESCDNETIEQEIISFAKKAIDYSTRNYLRPKTFLGVGGLKIFRDEIYSTHRFPFLADHRFYKINKIYDFPQKNIKGRVFGRIMTIMCKIPTVRKFLYEKEMRNKIVEPHEKLLATL